MANSCMAVSVYEGCFVNIIGVCVCMSAMIIGKSIFGTGNLDLCDPVL